MNSKDREIVFRDGTHGTTGDFPVAVVGFREEKDASTKETARTVMVVDPVFNYQIKDNLYGRIMTLLEATVETSRLKAVKDVFGKELRQWSADVYDSAREIAENGNSGNNIYN